MEAQLNSVQSCLRDQVFAEDSYTHCLSWDTGKQSESACCHYHPAVENRTILRGKWKVGIVDFQKVAGI
ncbi:MAG: hypothetical protein CM1200mP30_14480 [Pseudomonadota bacterium]|nr:MAG: hypothetical protein CM1200mP30_14480 [Pseudomonadota bacterium]